MNHLDGIAGRALLQRLTGVRERKRAADNDNICRQPEAAPGGVARGESLGRGRAGEGLTALRQRAIKTRDTRRPSGGLE